MGVLMLIFSLFLFPVFFSLSRTYGVSILGIYKSGIKADILFMLVVTLRINFEFCWSSFFSLKKSSHRSLIYLFQLCHCNSESREEEKLVTFAKVSMYGGGTKVLSLRILFIGSAIPSESYY